MCRVFASGPGDRGSVPGQVIPKTQKMVFDAALLKGKVEQSREWSGVVAIEKAAFGLPTTKVANFTCSLITIKVVIKGRGRSGTSRDSNPAGRCYSSAHLVQCEPDEASSFTKPNVGPGTYAGLWLELDSKV